MKLKQKFGRSNPGHSVPVNSNEVEQPALSPGEKKRILGKRLFAIFVGGLLVVGLLMGWHALRGDTSVVPKKIQKSVHFSIYYPASLPSGYTLDAQSFRLAEQGVILFTVTYDSGKSIVFSEQEQPSAGDIDKFINSYLPLNSILQLPLGQAKVGAYGSAPDIRTVLSLPIHDGPWLIATAPSEVSHDDLAKIVTSLTK
jgi:hypothetical protein